MQIQTLNESVEMNANTLAEVKSRNKEIRYKNKEIKAQLEEAQQKAAMVAEYMKFVNTFKNTGVTVTEINNGLYLIFPGGTTFETSKAVLNENIKTILNPIAENVIFYRGVNVIIRGHTDNSGTEIFNQKLSEDRAMAVSTYLVDKGVDSTRIKTIGVSSSEPIDNNDTKDGRIDIIITY